MQSGQRNPLGTISSGSLNRNASDSIKIRNANHKLPNARNKDQKSYFNKSKSNSLELAKPFKSSLTIQHHTPPPPQRSKSTSVDEDDDLHQPFHFGSIPSDPPMNSKSASKSHSKSGGGPSSKIPMNNTHSTTPSVPSTPKLLKPTKSKSNLNNNSNSNPFNHYHPSSPHQPFRTYPLPDSSSSTTNSGSLQNTTTNSCNTSISGTPLRGTSRSVSVEPSPGVIKDKKNIPSPQRVPIISLRSFHTMNHVEFYKPIPIAQSRSTQFELVNETYGHCSIQIKKANPTAISCITLSPTAIDLQRSGRTLITVTCTPLHAVRIKEVVRIEFGLHSIEVHVHAVGFEKSIRCKRSGKTGKNGNKGNNGNVQKSKSRKHRKRSLQNMRKEDTEQCQSVQSSLESSRSGSGNSSITNSAQRRRRIKSRKPLLSPTIRREKSFTAAPFSSPAPNKSRRNFMFNKAMETEHELMAVEEATNETEIGFTPKTTKKRRVMDPEEVKRTALELEAQKKKEMQERFEKLGSAVEPIQALFRQYLAMKQTKRLIQRHQYHEQKQQRHQRRHQRQQYYFGVIKLQLMTKRVRGHYLHYKEAANVIQSAFKTYCIQKKYNQHIHEMEMEAQRRLSLEQNQIRLEQERIERERAERQKEEEDRLRALREEEDRLRREREEEERRKLHEIESKRKEEEQRVEALRLQREEEEKQRVKELEIQREKEEKERNERLRKQREEEERLSREREEEELQRLQLIESKRKEEEVRMEQLRSQREEEERLRMEELERLKQEEDARKERERLRLEQEEKERNERIRKQREEEERLSREREEEELQRLQLIESKRKEEEQRMEQLRVQREEEEKQRIQELQRLDALKKEEEERLQRERLRLEQEQREREEALRIQHEEEEKRRMEEMERKQKEEMDRLEALRNKREMEEKEMQRQMEETRRREEEMRMERERIQREKEEEERQRLVMLERQRMEEEERLEILRKQREEEIQRQHEMEMRRLEEERMQREMELERERKAKEEQIRRDKEEEERKQREQMERMKKEEEERMERERLQKEWNEVLRKQQEEEERLKALKREREEEEKKKMEEMERKKREEEERLERERIQREQEEEMERQRIAELKAKQEREQALVQWMGSMLECKRTRQFMVSVRSAAVVVQSTFKMYLSRKECRKQILRRKAAVYIQSYIRGTAWRLQYIRVSHQLQLQRQHEAERERQRALQKRECVESLLSLYRLHQFRNIILEKRQQIEMRTNAVIAIQSWFRGTMTRKSYIEYQQQNEDSYTQKVIRIQAMIRGKLVRMELANDPGSELKAILQRVARANRNWKKENTVNYRLQAALSQISQSRTLYGVSEACDTLENLLKVVPNISARIVEHNIIGSLYNVLRNSNRSVPHLNLVQKILNFFLFFAKHDFECYAAIFHRDDTLEILSERLQVHRLDHVLFELVTQLFFVGVDVNVKNTENKFLMALRQSDVGRQLRTIQKIMCSKLEIAKRINKPLRRMPNARQIYKVKFEGEKTLSKCVQNMNRLVDRL